MKVKTTHRNTSRRYAPSFRVANSKLIISKILTGIASKFDVANDETIKEARINGAETIRGFNKGGTPIWQKTLPRCGNMRSERRETMNELKLAFIQKANYSLAANELFEVSCAPEELAKMIRQIHVYESGRVAIDCVRGGLRDFQISDYIIIFNEYDKNTGKNKASRIFLTPAFFESFGVDAEYLCDLMRSYRESLRRKGKLRERIEKDNENGYRRATSANIAGLSRTDLNAKLKRIKKQLAEIDERKTEEAALIKANKAAKKAAKEAAKEAAKAQEYRELSDRNTADILADNARFTANASRESRYFRDIKSLFDT